ncbi:MAG: hypothetical protein ACE5KF_06015 [Kiloniellaceae bacterium]
MRRLLAVCSIAATLAACAERLPEQSRVMRAGASLEGPAGDAVRVVVFDIPPGRRIERVVLIDPMGRRHPAAALVPATRETGTAAPGALVGLAVRGGSSSGIKPSVRLGLGLHAEAETYTSRRVLARVPLAEPAAFRDDAQHWRIEVIYLDIIGERKALTLPVRGP